MGPDCALLISFFALWHFYYCKTGRICNVVLRRGERIRDSVSLDWQKVCSAANDQGRQNPIKKLVEPISYKIVPCSTILCQLLLSYIINHQLLVKNNFFGTSCQHSPTVVVQLLPRAVGSSKCSSLSHHTPQW